MAAFSTIAVVASAVIGAAAAIYTSTRPSPTMPTPLPPVPNVSPSPAAPPQLASVARPDDAEGKARAGAARKQRDMESRRSNSSTILTTPLGVSTPAGNVKSSVLGR